MESAKSKVVTVAAITLLVGGVAGYALGNMSNDTKMSDASSQMQASEPASQDGVTVGGAKMVSTKDIVDNAVNAKNVSTVVSLVQQAGLVDTLKSSGPFTVFAPDNSAFEAVPKDILDKVSKDTNLLKTVLTYHVVPGTYTSADLRAMATNGETVKTVQGETLSFKSVDGNVVVMDKAGQEISIETPDVISTNGVTHVVKSVMLPVDPTTL